MNTIEIIRKKRDGRPLEADEINFVISNYTLGKIPDYQFSALLMAVYLNGMNKRETSALTDSMLHSGVVLNLKDIQGRKVDKHSTGGVGDKTSLIIAPIAAAAGVLVPMISGRGLGHTGGTLDKLESIPGFNAGLNLEEYNSVLRKCGAVLIGQTKEIAPADKLIYALRDVTATVESIPLITASIMSKKLAEGIDGLVLDVKTGSGAFMRKQSDATKLAESLIDTAKSFKKKVTAFITDMNQPLGHSIGNWLEVEESVRVLKGEKISDLLELSLALSGAMIHLGGKAASLEEGIDISEQIISSGRAFDKFIQIVNAQGGDIKYLSHPELYPPSDYSEKIISAKSGYLKSIDNYEIGMAALELGAGRMAKDDMIDPKAGIMFKAKIGDKLKTGDVVAEIFTDKKDSIDRVRKKIIGSLSFSVSIISKQKMIKKIIS